jgi:hypothetical protein
MASGERTTTADRSLSSALRLAERSNTEQDLPGFLNQYHRINEAIAVPGLHVFKAKKAKGIAVRY